MKDYANPNADFSDADRLAYIRAQNAEMSDADAREYLALLMARHEKKQELIERGFSNRLAEKWLDKAGWVRPFGWSSVFYYPGSNSLRWRYYIAIILLGFIAWKVLG